LENENVFDIDDPYEPPPEAALVAPWQDGGIPFGSSLPNLEAVPVATGPSFRADPFEPPPELPRWQASGMPVQSEPAAQVGGRPVESDLEAAVGLAVEPLGRRTSGHKTDDLPARGDGGTSAASSSSTRPSGAPAKRQLPEHLSDVHVVHVWKLMRQPSPAFVRALKRRLPRLITDLELLLSQVGREKMFRHGHPILLLDPEHYEESVVRLSQGVDMEGPDGLVQVRLGEMKGTEWFAYSEMYHAEVMQAVEDLRVETRSSNINPQLLGCAGVYSQLPGNHPPVAERPFATTSADLDLLFEQFRRLRGQVLVAPGSSSGGKRMRRLKPPGLGIPGDSSQSQNSWGSQSLPSSLPDQFANMNMMPVVAPTFISVLDAGVEWVNGPYERWFAAHQQVPQPQSGSLWYLRKGGGCRLFWMPPPSGDTPGEWFLDAGAEALYTCEGGSANPPKEGWQPCSQNSVPPPPRLEYGPVLP
jgi:hypothetical protein